MTSISCYFDKLNVQVTKSESTQPNFQKASHRAQICKILLIVPKFVDSQATSLFGKLKCEELKQLVLGFLQKKYNLTLLLFVFLIVSLLLMMFELLPFVSSCLLSPLLFIALFNEFLLFTELDFDKLVAVKKMKISPAIKSWGSFVVRWISLGSICTGMVVSKVKEYFRFCCSLNFCYSLGTILTGGLDGCMKS